MKRLFHNPMRLAGAALLAAALCCGSVPAMAFGECVGSRCAQIRRIPPPKHQHSQRKQLCCCETPPGWGWYLRQKYHHDCSQPLVVFDELGGGGVAFHQNW